MRSRHAKEAGGEGQFPFLGIKGTETGRDVVLAPGLDSQHRRDAKASVQEHKDISSDVPGRINLIECHLRMETDKPVHTKQYPVPFAVQDSIEDEVRRTLEMGIVERADSAYNSPVLVVKKPDQSYHLCVNSRCLNDVLTADSKPMPRADLLFTKIGAREFFSKIDFTKGHWQIPLTEESRPETAFSTTSGIYQFKYMPLELKTALAVFTRIMRPVGGRTCC